MLVADNRVLHLIATGCQLLLSVVTSRVRSPAGRPLTLFYLALGKYYLRQKSSVVRESGGTVRIRQPFPSAGGRLSIIQSKRYIKKIGLVGDSGVGKTSLIRRFVIDVFDDKYIATIGTKVSKRDVEYKEPDKTVYLTLMVWDILGQKDYRKMRAQGMSGAHGILLVCARPRPESV